MNTLGQLTVKVGEVSKTSRTTIHADQEPFTFALSDGYESVYSVLLDKIRQAVEVCNVSVEHVDEAIYLKPGHHSTQKDLVRLTHDNIHEKVSASQSNFDKRKKVDGPFVCQFFAFVAKKIMAPSGIRRATASRITEAAHAIDGYLAVNPTVEVGQIARTHWEHVHARQPPETDVTLPTSATFRQMQHLDTMRHAHAVRNAVEDEFQAITVRLNGSNDLLLSVNIRQLRAALGLPNHSLMAAGIFHSFVPPAMPEDVDDVDHTSD